MPRSSLSLVVLLAFALVVSAWRTGNPPGQPVKDIACFTLEDSVFVVGAVYRPDPPILYDYDKATVLPKCLQELDRIADFLVAHPGLTLEVGVHTDTRGSAQYSVRLDQVRANQVRGYLSAKGVHSERLSAKGYGASQPRIQAADIDRMPTAREQEEAHALNRRTEFKITGTDYIRE